MERCGSVAVGRSERGDDAAGAVLDVSFDPRAESGLRFIDVDWEDLLPSLKPMGLNIMLNTNCQQPMLAMALADHVRYLSLVEVCNHVRSRVFQRAAHCAQLLSDYHGCDSQQYNDVISARKKCLCLLGKVRAQRFGWGALRHAEACACSDFCQRCMHRRSASPTMRSTRF